MTAGRVHDDLGGQQRAGGPTGEDAMATADELGRLELPAAALGLEDDNVPRWMRVTAKKAR